MARIGRSAKGRTVRRRGRERRKVGEGDLAHTQTSRACLRLRHWLLLPAAALAAASSMCVVAFVLRRVQASDSFKKNYCTSPVKTGLTRPLGSVLGVALWRKKHPQHFASLCTRASAFSS